MAVKTKDEILEIIKNRFGDDTSDETISFIEDVSDTFDDYEARMTEDWKQKYDELDKSWREKYKARFFSKEVEKPVENVEEATEEKLTYDKLFKEE